MIGIGTRQATREVSTLAQPSKIPLGIVTVMAVWFISSYAYRYLTFDSEQFGIFRPRAGWLVLHVAGGTAALLIGPIQFWFGSQRSKAVVHRILGIGYLMCVAISSAAAFYMAAHTDFGWVFGMGLTSLAIAWVATTGLAVLAISRCLIEQHREWMVRSYVVTFGFVIFRAVVEVFEIAGTGTTVERLTAASWMCWAVPLLIAEMMLQGRKIFMYGVQVPERLAARESGLLELMKSTENTVVSRPPAPSKVRLEQPQSVVESNL